MDEIAYCGLDCTICVYAKQDREACAGCHQGGGARDCYQRMCCEKKELDGCYGCWLYKEFPCSSGFFGDETWRGLCIGCCDVIKKVGVERYTRLVRERMGERVELGDFRFKNSQDIERILLNDD